jgi:hypothetical protein
LSVPFFLRCIADLTRFAAALPYFAIRDLFAALCKEHAHVPLVHSVLQGLE